MSVDKNSLLPLYHQVEESIRQDIANRIYLPGQSIPTELELQEKFNVSRETIRKAVNNLVVAGLVEKRKGVGTFVTHPKIIHRIGIKTDTFPYSCFIHLFKIFFSIQSG